MSENGIVPSGCDHSLPSAKSWRTRLGRVFLSRPVGILAGSITLLIFLGCMSLSIGCRTQPEDVIKQEGKVSLQNEQEIDVYYPIPYASPPNLEIDGNPGEYEIIEQKADHFRIRCKRLVIGGDECCHWDWKARGPKCSSPGAAPTVIVTPPSPPPVPSATNGPPAPLPPPTPVQAP